jgi:hypothetical protein
LVALISPALSAENLKMKMNLNVQLISLVLCGVMFQQNPLGCRVPGDSDAVRRQFIGSHIQQGYLKNNFV